MALGEIINKLRTDAKLTQEQFASIFDVSQQSVGKWENGEVVPELSKLIKISKYFGMSLDALILEKDERNVHEMQSKTLRPEYKIAGLWDYYPTDLMLEYRQSYDEGLDIECYKSVFESVARLPKSVHKKELADALFDVIQNAPLRADYKYIEPDELEQIKALRKPYDYEKKKGESLENRVYGAWLGRTCGCMLGKSLECIHLDELIPFLKESGNYPMHRYVYRTDITEKVLNKYSFVFNSRPYIDEVEAFPPDDDMNYTVMYQEIIDASGKGFTSFDVARKWLSAQIKDSYCTAERVAYSNFIKGFAPPESARYKNPHRELIGAQIRADYFGYVNPGNPELAAEMAWRDARISHVKNGIYGEMFVAAMLAAAAETDDLKDIIRAGLAQIPHTSRLYESIVSVLNDFKNGMSQKEWFKNFQKKYNDKDSYDWTHTNHNAMLVCACLLYGDGDYAKSICMAVESGFDTDCNGATVGSIIGMAKGKDVIPEYWSKPINGQIETTLIGVGKVAISDRVELTLKHINK